jgi:excisionase family DNA binding protein
MSAVVPHQPLLTVRALAELLSVNEKTVRRLVASGALPALWVGGQLRFDVDEIRAWLYAPSRSR